MKFTPFIAVLSFLSLSLFANVQFINKTNEPLIATVITQQGQVKKEVTIPAAQEMSVQDENPWTANDKITIVDARKQIIFDRFERNAGKFGLSIEINKVKEEEVTNTGASTTMERPAQYDIVITKTIGS